MLSEKGFSKASAWKGLAGVCSKGFWFWSKGFSGTSVIGPAETAAWFWERTMV